MICREKLHQWDDPDDKETYCIKCGLPLEHAAYVAAVEKLLKDRSQWAKIYKLLRDVHKIRRRKIQAELKKENLAKSDAWEKLDHLETKFASAQNEVTRLGDLLLDTGECHAKELIRIRHERQQAQDEVVDISYRFACVLEHATDGLMSKTNYEKEIMYAAIDENINKYVEENNKEIAEELATSQDEVARLRGYIGDVKGLKTVATELARIKPPFSFVSLWRDCGLRQTQIGEQLLELCKALEAGE